MFDRQPCKFLAKTEITLGIKIAINVGQPDNESKY